jgi:hypothetical protein
MKHEVVIVSGLSRSGSSLMMQMLQAGGMPILVDEHLRPDQHNPRGYYEYQPANFPETVSDAIWRASREGRAVKLLAPRIDRVPTELRYKIIWMKRPFSQIVESKKRMAESGTWFNVETRTPEQLREIVRSSAARMLTVLDAEVCVIEHNSLMHNTFGELAKLQGMLPKLDLVAMAKCVDPHLWHHRPFEITV